MYRLQILERIIHDILGRFCLLLGLDERIYLKPVIRLGRNRSGPIDILFVCKGNICRSPYAEVRFRKEVAKNRLPPVSVSSAGLDAGEGSSAFPTAIEVAQKRGIDLRSHTTTKMTLESAERADLIVAMEPGQLRELGAISADGKEKAILLGALLLREKGNLTTPDPYGKPAGEFEACFDKIDRAVEVLLQRLAAGGNAGGKTE